jgi:hypothetical protein
LSRNLQNRFVNKTISLDAAAKLSRPQNEGIHEDGNATFSLRADGLVRWRRRQFEHCFG